MDTELCTEKEQMRKEGLRKRDALSEEARKEQSSQVLQQLLRTDFYKKARQLLCYVNFRSEVETTKLLQQALLDGKEVYCPRVCGREMAFYRIYALEELVSGSYGILEPEAREEKLLTNKMLKQALMIMPGAVFDRQGYRIGYGAGYYDKYLSQLGAEKEQLIKAAILFSIQLVPQVASEQHDSPADFLITEQEIIPCR